MIAEPTLTQYEHRILFEIYEEKGMKYIHFSGYFEQAPRIPGMSKNLWIPYDMFHSDFTITDFLKQNQDCPKGKTISEILPDVKSKPSLPISEQKATDSLRYLVANRSWLEFFEVTEDSPCGEYYAIYNAFKPYEAIPYQFTDKTGDSQEDVWVVQHIKTGEKFKQKGEIVLFPKKENTEFIVQTLNQKALRAQDFQNYMQAIVR